MFLQAGYCSNYVMSNLGALTRTIDNRPPQNTVLCICNSLWQIHNKADAVSFVAPGGSLQQDAGSENSVTRCDVCVFSAADEPLVLKSYYEVRALTDGFSFYSAPLHFIRLDYNFSYPHLINTILQHLSCICLYNLFMWSCNIFIPCRLSQFTFLADRTIGRAYGTVCRLSVVRRPSSVRL